MQLSQTNILVAVAVVLIVIILLVVAVYTRKSHQQSANGGDASLQNIDSLVETPGTPKQKDSEIIDRLIAKANRLQDLD